MRPRPLLLELRELWRLALPLALVQAGSEVMRTADTAIVGRLGAAPLGALGLGNALFFAISILGIGIMLGLDPLVAQAIGAGDRLHARRLLWQGVWLALAVGGVLSVVLIAALPLFAMAGISADVAALARPFLAARIAGLVPFLIFAGLRSYLQAVGLTWPMVLAMGVSNVFNLGAALLLVFGGSSLSPAFGPLRDVPAYGSTGAALGTSIALWVQLLVLALVIARRERAHRLPVARRPDGAILRRAARVGLPIGLQLTAEVGIFALIALLAGRLGSGALAAHQIALTLSSFTFTVVLGIGAAGSVRVGRAVGARDQEGARRAGLVAFASGAGVMALAGLAFFLFPSGLARLFTDDPALIALAAPLLVVAAFYQLSDGAQAVGSGVLRGAGDTVFPLWANVAGHYAVGLPVALLLVHFAGGGVVGLWWGLCAGLTAVALTLLARFLWLSGEAIAPIEAVDR